MNTEKDNFLDYLTNVAKKTNGKNYTPLSIIDYGRAVDRLGQKISYHLKMNIDSIFNITNVKQLKKIYTSLFSIPEIIREEASGNAKSSNAFKRYIEFREFEQEITNKESNEEQDEHESRTEGGIKVIVSKIAERDAKLRKSAIRIHGCKCKACEFDFFKNYGDIGKGFIEIHHCKPLGKNKGTSIKTNPKTDLIPLCSNCHRIVHRKRNIIMTLDELQQTIKRHLR